MGNKPSGPDAGAIMAQQTRANAEANALRDEKMMMYQQSMMQQQKDEMQGKCSIVPILI